MAGRPSIEAEARGVNVVVRVLPSERERWKSAAELAGVSVSEWIRSMANDRAARVEREKGGR